MYTNEHVYRMWQGIYLVENTDRLMIFFFLDDHVKRNPSRREIWKQPRLSSRTHVEVDIFLRRSKYRERASFAGYVSSRVRRSFDEILITSFLLHVSRWLALCSISRYPEASTANNIGCTYVPSQPIIPLVPWSVDTSESTTNNKEKKEESLTIRLHDPSDCWILERSATGVASRLHYKCKERAVARLHLQTGLARVLSYLVVINSVVGRRRTTEHRENKKKHRIVSSSDLE